MEIFWHDAFNCINLIVFMGICGIYHWLLCVFSCQIGTKRTLSDVPVQAPAELTLEKAVKLLKDAFLAAAERDVYTGDTVTLMAITAKGTETTEFQLRRDWFVSLISCLFCYCHLPFSTYDAAFLRDCSLVSCGEIKRSHCKNIKGRLDKIDYVVEYVSTNPC